MQPRSDVAGPSGNSAPQDSAGFAFDPTVRQKSKSKSPRAFRSLAKAIQGIARAQAIADEGLPRGVDVTALVQRIAVTLSTPETYRKVVENMFAKYSVLDANGETLLPLDRLPDILSHWQIPEDHAPIFWAMLRKQETHWDKFVMPDKISFEDLQSVLLKVLRRVRDKYCDQKVNRHDFVKENERRMEQEYHIVGECGKGSFGECFWVTHRASRVKRVAKKICKEESKVPSEEVVSELNTLKHLDHPHIVRVFEWFESEESYYLVLEGANGGDLKHVLDRWRGGHSNPGLEEHFVQMVTSQSLSALAYIHGRHIIHRDIKPANVLLASSDLEKPHVLLADFGIAELFEEHGRMSSMVKGTLAYMAPEVFMSEVCPRSDVWAVGIVSYELLLGKRPFVAENPMAMFARLKNEVKWDELRDAGVSEEAVAFNTRILAKDPVRRPSAREALEDPWMTANNALSKMSGRKVRKLKRGLTTFMHMSHFSKAVMNCVAAQLDTSRIEGLAEVFEALDTDKDGELSPAELAAGLAELGVDPDSIVQLVDALDINNNRSVEYSEFVASLLTAQGKLVEDVLYQAFYVIDVNHDGVINKEELRSMLSGGGPLVAVMPDGKTVDQVLSEVDTSRDGVISFDEFKTYLLNAGMVDPSAPNIDPDEVLTETLPRLCDQLLRTKAELDAQAARLADVHWITTVGDLRRLEDSEWPRLGLPLKLEHALRELIRS